MERSTSKWSSKLMLTWLLAAETALGAPKPPETTDSFKTQYPPATEARLLGAETQGFYPFSLEREGHQIAHPAAQPTSADGPLLGLVHGVKGILGHPASLVDDLIDGLEGALDTSHQSAPKPTVSHPTPTEETHPTTPPIPPATKNTAPADTPAPTQETRPHTASNPQPAKDTVPAVENPTSKSAEPEIAKPTHPANSQGSIATAMASHQDVFIPVATGPIPQTIKSRNDHPVPKESINSTGPIETNKFYSGLFLGTQSNTTFTHPYGLAWSKGSGNLQSWGMAISHVEADKLALGPKNNNITGNPIAYYINPIGIQSIILSAQELKSETVLTTENPLPFSANAVLQPSPGSASRITFPVVQGMGFVTGVYSDLQPNIESAVHYKKLVSAGSPRSGVFKYVATLADETTWIIYLTPSDGQDPDPRLESANLLRGPQGWSGIIQVAKNPAGVLGEKMFDNSAGVYAVEGAVSGAVSGRTGTYNLAWAKSGKDAESTPLMMFALPHHVESFDNSTISRATNITLRTTTKGNAVAVIGEVWTMTEPELPIEMGLAPWSASTGSIKLSSQAQRVLNEVAPTELRQDVDKETNLNSMYYSGKALSKFATLVYTVNTLGGNETLAASTLQELKKAFAVFANNKQQYPLVYDAVWKGVVSSASYDGGDSGADFGNTLYNDHHFHYGYFIHAAAIIGALEPQWIEDNKDWVNMLVRDAGNAAGNDPLFPFSRSFDWYNGHSWAKGLFESFDGKDEESTSEDTMFAYALKMWGHTIGDASMEARGNLMLGILRRSLHNYFLLEKGNKNHPAAFVPNKVTGILFENKVDHTTYFGNNLEYIQGIHMLPLLPFSAYVRSQQFVREEWEAMFASHAAAPAEEVGGGWKGVLYANLALIDPDASWKFFAQQDFNYTWIDGGASRTWYLAFAAES
ncbi:hypothetical protein FE257_012364 [Aspergillus nanangensis]|uniref:Glucan endo-1,3-beta-D-glucosidase 1 n=1 Tax=Aspergillus nanangensis TaxID=2582783 RepID=A0AAD4CHJ8_ASPNN|nr:hypothetical protein FE257_012364 [Aspergillus nanangensis]